MSVYYFLSLIVYMKYLFEIKGKKRTKGDVYRISGDVYRMNRDICGIKRGRLRDL